MYNANYVDVLTCLFCGFVIGIEREIKGKDSGLKTLILVCLGSFVYVQVGISMGDPARVLAQIASGVGFIGSGVIILNKDKVSGLSSASIIWISAAIGALCAIGHDARAIGLSLGVASIDYIIDKIKTKAKK